MAKLLIIADDLTGALDTGAQLAKHRVSTLVLPQAEDLDEAWRSEAVVINTESRHASPSSAGQAVASAVEIGQRHKVLHFYKKTDSTLRGNVGSELQALLRTCGAQRLMFVPAFPRLRRTTAGGVQFVDGVELHRTEYARDPLNPIRSSDIAQLVQTQTYAEVHKVLLRELPGLNEACRDGIYIFDCSTEGQLDEIGSTISRLGWTKALAGSAGFADRLADLLGLARKTSPAGLSLSRRVLVVNGSMSPTAARQVANFKHLGCPVIHLAAPCEQRTEEVIQTVKMQPSDCVVLTSTEVDGGRPSLSPQIQEAALSFAGNFGRAVAAVIEQVDFQLVIIFGGDTFAGIVRALDCKSIVPLAEILPGVALSKLCGRDREILAISKAGGFGGDDILPLLFREIRRLDR